LQLVIKQYKSTYVICIKDLINISYDLIAFFCLMVKKIFGDYDYDIGMEHYPVFVIHNHPFS